MTDPSQPTDVEVEAAAHTLYALGHHHHWLPTSLPARYDQMDPIGKAEFEDIVVSILIAAAKARSDPAAR
jgi:hypothetical protein